MDQVLEVRAVSPRNSSSRTMHLARPRKSTGISHQHSKVSAMGEASTFRIWTLSKLKSSQICLKIWRINFSKCAKIRLIQNRPQDQGAGLQGRHKQRKHYQQALVVEYRCSKRRPQHLLSQGDHQQKNAQKILKARKSSRQMYLEAEQKRL